MKKLLLILLTITFFQNISFGQVTVSGKVTDKNKNPLVGVTVAEKGSTNGTYTDSQGDYSIVLKKTPAPLIFSYIGYATQEISVTTETHLDVIMNDAATELAAV